jgi:hypothetical protein
MASLRSLLLLLTPLVVFGDAATMTLVHPKSESHPHTPYFWEQQSSSISVADIAQSSLRLMGVAPKDAESAKALPSPDVISPPQAIFFLAVDSNIATNMPKLQALIEEGASSQVRQSDMGFDVTLEQLGFSMGSFDAKWKTQCASAVETLGSSLSCPSAQDLASIMQSFGAKQLGNGAWSLQHGTEELNFVTDAEVELLGELATIQKMKPTESSESFYAATLSTSLDKKELAEFGPLADAVLSKAISDLSNAHHGSLVFQVVQMNPHRFLSEQTPTPAPTAAVELTVEQISTYQICLWTGIGLVMALLSAICCMINMDVRPDSLLYAKFQADVSSKSE